MIKLVCFVLYVHNQTVNWVALFNKEVWSELQMGRPYYMSEDTTPVANHGASVFMNGAARLCPLIDVSPKHYISKPS